MIRGLVFYGLVPVCGYLAAAGFCRTRRDLWLGAGAALVLVALASGLFWQANWAWDKDAIVWVVLGMLVAQAANGVLAGVLVRVFWRLASPGPGLRALSLVAGSCAAVGAFLLWPFAWE